MAFIKHGDGKIVHIVKVDELSEDEKKSVDKLKHSTKSTQDSEKSSELEKR